VANVFNKSTQVIEFILVTDDSKPCSQETLLLSRKIKRKCIGTFKKGIGGFKT
jgi:hypothetical protein